MPGEPLTFGSLFSGVGGFDVGLERAGMQCRWQVEKDNICRSVLRRHWPDVTLHRDITEGNDYDPVTLICGGDPCPCRSKAKGNRKSIHPDLSGYFLAVVGRCRPRWVVRENVPASDDIDFVTALEILGYHTVIIRANAAAVTGQNRERDFIVGCPEKARLCKFIELCIRQSSNRDDTTECNQAKGYPCLSANRARWDARDGYVWDGSGRLRVADKDERGRLAGLPSGWLDGLSETAVARVCGNAVVPQIAEWLGRRIIEADER